MQIYDSKFRFFKILFSLNLKTSFNFNVFFFKLKTYFINFFKKNFNFFVFFFSQIFFFFYKFFFFFYKLKQKTLFFNLKNFLG